ncbi:hypothetical protein GON01_05220 [Sphingomonas sp. MAH-20]|uniref:TonB C-terminal domain-containing protein n=1 Tax=Sphingomonas horti TaxID=2682842 RepID=A0A6I4IZQ6_9SPHN|nr:MULTISPECIES: hypothetical protein [Sphingomonas]MBA2918371.1 hypothetical protein [Sphingomonas sp. CGMCC 1.13658]MVO77338.1 hypothetical protein [Sphingomonas horti]
MPPARTIEFLPRRPSAELVAKATADAAAQVKRCYRAPKVFGTGRRISTKLAVRYAPDGSIIGLPSVVSQGGVTPENAMFADDMAAAAIESVVRCSPLHLPPELYAYGWSSFELTFSPVLRG